MSKEAPTWQEARLAELEKNVPSWMKQKRLSELTVSDLLLLAKLLMEYGQ